MWVDVARNGRILLCGTPFATLPILHSPSLQVKIDHELSGQDEKGGQERRRRWRQDDAQGESILTVGRVSTVIVNVFRARVLCVPWRERGDGGRVLSVVKVGWRLRRQVCFQERYSVPQ